ncbi:response regulator transcription factor [Neobacillus niacini]|uniref:response regulator transcription factor n=1 Tax=Neobacillus niacini TaxID=86668 RepID=UPI002857DF2B|nr:response regulator transcription factor [Neobacillus niacini]MDR7000949.1 two-component system competent response regulator ComA [Neobacillus niacini]
MIHILLVDDHPLMGEGTKLILEKEEDIKVQFESSSLQALEKVKTQSFDVMLFDSQMPELDGFELTKRVLAIEPDATILIYTDNEIFPYMNLLIEAGAIGFISKTSTKDHLIRTIRCAINREVIIPFTLLKEIYRGFESSLLRKPSKEGISFNEKENKILTELVKGKTNKEIAQTMFIGQRTLEYNLTNLFQKLGVHSRIEAIVKVKDLGLIDL